MFGKMINSAVDIIGSGVIIIVRVLNARRLNLVMLNLIFNTLTNIKTMNWEV